MRPDSPLPNNQQAALSLAFSLLTILSACTGLVPIPFTGFICFPLSFLFATLALLFGLVALAQIRRRAQAGSPMAWAGIIIGGLVFFCGVCLALTFASLFFFAPQYIPKPQQFWNGSPL
ncbi:MAG: hypothetical protein Fur002_13620 [Anaerolineales bacterium]